MSRDPAHESDFLHEAHKAAKADAEGFVAEVHRRLRAGGEEYGESFTERTAAELMHEAKEEAADLTGWCMLASQRLAGPDAEHTTKILTQAAARSMQAWALIDLALETEEWTPSRPDLNQPPVRLCSE